MIEEVARFEKVSFEQYCSDSYLTGAKYKIFESKYNNIRLPIRATKGSAGYDFFLVDDLHLQAGETIKICTGIRCEMKKGWMLFLCPKGGLGFKFRLQLDNTVGIVDQDYYHSDNEGHIMIKITNDGRKGQVLKLSAGSPIVQGIFIPFGVVYGDNVQLKRNGGFGSTRC